MGVSTNIWKRFIFLPAYEKTEVFTTSIVDCTKRIKADGLGMLTTSDIYALTKYFKFTAEYLEFHSPSEHVFEEGVYADLEMQIYHSDDFGKSKSKNGLYISILFNKGGEHNPFFDFLDDASAGIDLSLLLDIDMMMRTQIFGYTGTLTKPPCEGSVGWYIPKMTLSVSDE